MFEYGYCLSEIIQHVNVDRALSGKALLDNNDLGELFEDFGLMTSNDVSSSHGITFEIDKEQAYWEEQLKPSNKALINCLALIGITAKHNPEQLTCDGTLKEQSIRAAAYCRKHDEAFRRLEDECKTNEIKSMCTQLNGLRKLKIEKIIRHCQWNADFLYSQKDWWLFSKVIRLISLKECELAERKRLITKEIERKAASNNAYSYLNKENEKIAQDRKTLEKIKSYNINYQRVISDYTSLRKNENALSKKQAYLFKKNGFCKYKITRDELVFLSGCSLAASFSKQLLKKDHYHALTKQAHDQAWQIDEQKMLRKNAYRYFFRAPKKLLVCDDALKAMNERGQATLKMIAYHTDPFHSLLGLYNTVKHWLYDKINGKNNHDVWVKIKDTVHAMQAQRKEEQHAVCRAMLMQLSLKEQGVSYLKNNIPQSLTTEAYESIIERVVIDNKAQQHFFEYYQKIKGFVAIHLRSEIVQQRESRCLFNINLLDSDTAYKAQMLWHDMHQLSWFKPIAALQSFTIESDFYEDMIQSKLLFHWHRLEKMISQLNTAKKANYYMPLCNERCVPIDYAQALKQLNNVQQLLTNLEKKQSLWTRFSNRKLFDALNKKLKQYQHAIRITPLANALQRALEKKMRLLFCKNSLLSGFSQETLSDIFEKIKFNCQLAASAKHYDEQYGYSSTVIFDKNYYNRYMINQLTKAIAGHRIKRSDAIDVVKRFGTTKQQVAVEQLFDFLEQHSLFPDYSRLKRDLACIHSGEKLFKQVVAWHLSTRHRKMILSRDSIKMLYDSAYITPHWFKKNYSDMSTSLSAVRQKLKQNKENHPQCLQVINHTLFCHQLHTYYPSASSTDAAFHQAFQCYQQEVSILQDEIQSYVDSYQGKSHNAWYLVLHLGSDKAINLYLKKYLNEKMHATENDDFQMDSFEQALFSDLKKYRGHAYQQFFKSEAGMNILCRLQWSARSSIKNCAKLTRQVCNQLSLLAQLKEVVDYQSMHKTVMSVALAQENPKLFIDQYKRYLPAKQQAAADVYYRYQKDWQQIRQGQAIMSLNKHFDTLEHLEHRYGCALSELLSDLGLAFKTKRGCSDQMTLYPIIKSLLAMEGLQKKYPAARRLAITAETWKRQHDANPNREIHSYVTTVYFNDNQHDTEANDECERMPSTEFDYSS